MSLKKKSSSKNFLRLMGMPFAAGVTSLYLLIGSLWIYFSDLLVMRLAKTEEQFCIFSTYKGWFYVFSTATLLFLVLNRFISRIRKTQQQLRESEDRYEIAISAANIGVWDRDIVNNRLIWDKQMARIYGVQPEEFGGAHEAWKKCIHPEDRDRAEQDVKQAERGEKDFDTEFRIVRPDGEVRHIKAFGKALYDNAGKPVRMTGVNYDVTPSRQMQEAIKKRILALTRPLDTSEEITFADLFDLEEIQHIQDEFAAATSVASIITQPDGTPITQPSDFTRLCKDIIRKTEKGCTNCFKSDAALGRHHPEGPIVETCLSGGLWDAGVSITIGDRHIANWMIGQVRDETQTEKKMLAYAREIGADENAFIKAFREVPAMSRAHFEQIAQALFTLANQISTSVYRNIQQARFITAEKKNQAELLRLSTAIEQSPENIMITGPDGILQYVNPAFETITGYSREEALGKTPRFLKSGTHDAAFYSDLWKTITSGKIWEGRFVNKRKNGALYTEEASISPVRDPSGTITGYVAVKRDITKELAQEEQFRQSQKMDALGQLTGGIAHDFNNILQAILGFSEILLNRMNKGSIEHRNAAEIQKAAWRAAEMTRQLLAFSRKQPAEKTRTDLNAIVRDTEVLLQLLLGDKVKLTFELDPAPYEISADHGQLTQIVMNLAVNARDALPKGGRLTIKTENFTLDPQAAAEISAVEPGSFVCLSITDTGCGMSHEVKGHLFEPFFTTKAVGQGTGLGLSVVYGIVKQNKGWIHVYSEVGLGTTIKIYLPACETPAENPQTTRTQHERILLVEDDATRRDLVAQALESAGYKPVVAASAEDALELFKLHEEPFDMLFSDILLPGKSGIELADLLREKNPGLPILLYSGYPDQRARWNHFEIRKYHVLQDLSSISGMLAAVHDTLIEPVE